MVQTAHTAQYCHLVVAIPLAFSRDIDSTNHSCITQLTDDLYFQVAELVRVAGMLCHSLSPLVCARASDVRLALQPVLHHPGQPSPGEHLPSCVVLFPHV